MAAARPRRPFLRARCLPIACDSDRGNAFSGLDLAGFLSDSTLALMPRQRLRVSFTAAPVRNFHSRFFKGFSGN